MYSRIMNSHWIAYGTHARIHTYQCPHTRRKARTEIREFSVVGSKGIGRRISFVGKVLFQKCEDDDDVEDDLVYDDDEDNDN